MELKFPLIRGHPRTKRSCPNSCRVLWPEEFVRSKPAAAQQSVEWHLSIISFGDRAGVSFVPWDKIGLKCELSSMGRLMGNLDSFLLVGDPLARKELGGPCMEGGMGRREKDCPPVGLGLGLTLWEGGRLCPEVTRETSLEDWEGSASSRTNCAGQNVPVAWALSGGVLTILCLLQL